MKVRYSGLRNLSWLTCLLLAATVPFNMGGCNPVTPPVTDTDNDGIADDSDTCADTPADATVDADGCAASQLDGDEDGVTNDLDQCLDTPAGAAVDETGCTEDNPPRPLDADGDTVADENDDCSNTVAGATVDANGCSAEQRDTDGDDVNDALDECPNTREGATVEANGCPPGSTGDMDNDDDGVENPDDDCPDTATGATVDTNGCALSQMDTDGDSVKDDVDTCENTPTGEVANNLGCGPSQRDTDGDMVNDNLDQCPDTPTGSVVGTDGCTRTDGGGGGGGGGGGTTPPICGNGLVETGETCDPPATGSCDSACQTIATATSINADACASAVTLNGEGTFPFDNTTATQDGPAHTSCVFSGQDQLTHDVWACWTAPCTGTVFVRTCNLTQVDTKIAVYPGCGCPTDANNPIACNDDGCSAQSFQSLLTFEAVSGQQFMVRLGTYPGTTTTVTPGGRGSVTISCGVPNCPGTGSCSIAHPTPGCEDADCCEKTCAIDPFCCATNWDSVCVSESAGICSGSFSACGRDGAGSCTNINGTGSPGCSDTECCNSVCEKDPFCCLQTWDDRCAQEGAGTCHSTCGTPEGGDCFTAHATPGCNNDACCAEVCPRDPFCCLENWDADCALKAEELCR